MRKASAPTWWHTSSMSVFTLAMMSLEQGFLAAFCSVTLSRRTAQSVCLPPHMTLEPRPPPELRRGSRHGQRPASASHRLKQPSMSADVPGPSESSHKPDLHGNNQIPEIRAVLCHFPLRQLFQTSALVFVFLSYKCSPLPIFLFLLLLI